MAQNFLHSVILKAHKAKKGKKHVYHPFRYRSADYDLWKYFHVLKPKICVLSARGFLFFIPFFCPFFFFFFKFHTRLKTMTKSGCLCFCFKRRYSENYSRRIPQWKKWNNTQQFVMCVRNAVLETTVVRFDEKPFF